MVFLSKLLIAVYNKYNYIQTLNKTQKNIANHHTSSKCTYTRQVFVLGCGLVGKKLQTFSYFF